MQFTKFDIVLLTTMSLALIVMSFTFPALGLTDKSDETNESDVPDFNITADRFDIAGEFPESPGTPQSGSFTYDQTNPVNVEGVTQVWVDRPKSDGISLTANNNSQQDFKILVEYWANGNVDQEYNFTITQEGDQWLHNPSNRDWVIRFTVVELNNFQESDMNATIEYKIESTPAGSEGGLFENIPVLSGLWNGGEQLVAMLGYLGDIIFWFVGTAVEVALNIVGVLYDTMTFLVDTLQWITGTYSDIISAADSWAAVVLAVPGLLLTFEFGKLALLAISLLPTT